jgi:hypothetical protein
MLLFRLPLGAAATAALLLTAQTETFARPSRTEVTTNCIGTLAEARQVSGWRNSHLRYHLKDGAKCWFNPDDDEMPTRVAKAKPKAVTVTLASASSTPIMNDTPTPTPVSPTISRWLPDRDFDEVEQILLTACGGPCPQLEGQYETWTDDSGRLRYRRIDYPWQGASHTVRTQKFTR